MRVLYVDIDSLRPDHLGCYGYARPTSPVIDGLAKRGTRFDNYYTSDAPCLPSRTALFGGRFGIHSGVVGHGGTAADPFIQGEGRGFQSWLGRHSWMASLRRAGYRTATVSTFGERHSAWHWYAGFQEIFNHGTMGQESAHDVLPYAEDWLARHAREDRWFLHVNLWDPHTPYRVPLEYGEPFATLPPPDWLTDELLATHRASYGPHSACEPTGWGVDERVAKRYPRMPQEIDSLGTFKRWIDGYDTGIHYADAHVARLLDALEAAGVRDETLILVSADHGENQGELNVYGDHQTADQITCRVPLIVSGPGVAAGAVDRGLHYNVDLAPTICELLQAPIPETWDGQSFASALQGGTATGRGYLVLSQAAWACQRGVRFEDWLLLRTYEPGLKAFPPTMLFDLARDPHEVHDLADRRPEVVNAGLALLERWQTAQMETSAQAVDPMWTVVREGGAYHARGELERYARRLEATGRQAHAERLLAARRA